jgi:hypothetical protein
MHTYIHTYIKSQNNTNLRVYTSCIHVEHVYDMHAYLPTQSISSFVEQHVFESVCASAYSYVRNCAAL